MLIALVELYIAHGNSRVESLTSTLPIYWKNFCVLSDSFWKNKSTVPKLGLCDHISRNNAQYISSGRFDSTACHIKNFEKPCIKEIYIDLFLKLICMCSPSMCINKWYKYSGSVTQEKHFSCTCAVQKALNSLLLRLPFQNKEARLY